MKRIAGKILCSLVILTVHDWPLAAQDSPEFIGIQSGEVFNEAGSSYGVTWIDYDRDGLLDLFVANYSSKNFLYHNVGSGRFEKNTTSGIVVHSSGASSGPAWGDYNNDGWVDLFVANQSNKNNLLFRNDGQGGFTRIDDGQIVNDRGDSFNASWIDYDNDGNLDLYVANNTFFGTRSGENDFLYHNTGDETFERVIIGLIGNEKADNTGIGWIDYDNDRLMDLFVTTWNGKNRLFKNNGDHSFTQITAGDLVNTVSSSISCAWADYNNDGFPDVFIGNGWPDLAYNNLYLNNGDGTFTQSVHDAVAIEKGHCWNAVPGDYDNDGDLDLFVTNYGSRNQLYSNNGDGSFTRILTGGIVSDDYSKSTSGAMWGDYDNDGDLDLFAANEQSGNVLYQNQGNGNHWLEVICKGVISNASAIGARVKVQALVGGRPVWQMRDVSACTGLRSENLVLHFGLSDAVIADSLVVLWPSGQITVQENVPADQVLTLVEQIPENYMRPDFRADISRGVQPLVIRFQDKSLADPLNPVTSWEWDFDNDGIIDSNEMNPAHTFITDSDEYYSVRLTISNGKTSQTKTKTNYILVLASPNDNLAAGTKAYASSSANKTTFSAGSAIDGSMDTRWLSKNSDPQWLLIDLGIPSDIGGAVIKWDNVFALEYKIDVSADSLNWINVHSTLDGDGETDGISFQPVVAQFVRMTGTKRNIAGGYSIREFEVYNRIMTGMNTRQKEIAGRFSLLYNYPNPFNSATCIRYQLDEPADVRITLWNISGQKIKSFLQENREAGTHSVVWQGIDDNGNPVPSGLYFYRFQVRGNGSDYSKTGKMMMVK